MLIFLNSIKEREHILSDVSENIQVSLIELYQSYGTQSCYKMLGPEVYKARKNLAEFNTTSNEQLMKAVNYARRNDLDECFKCIKSLYTSREYIECQNVMLDMYIAFCTVLYSRLKIISSKG